MSYFAVQEILVHTRVNQGPERKGDIPPGNGGIEQDSVVGRGDCGLAAWVQETVGQGVRGEPGSLVGPAERTIGARGTAGQRPETV